MIVYLTDSELSQLQNWAQVIERLLQVIKTNKQTYKKSPLFHHSPKHKIQTPDPRSELRLHDNDQKVPVEERPRPCHPLSFISLLLLNPKP